MRKDIKIDTVIGERMHVLAKTKFFEPLRDVFGYLDGSPYRGSGQNLLLLGYPVHRGRMSALGHKQTLFAPVVYVRFWG